MMKKRLLILDDDEAVGKTIEAIARRCGFETRLCMTPDGFFADIDAWLPSHAAIDLVMPTMDGIEVLRSLAGKHCAARIIVTSGMGAKILESAQRLATERGLNFLGILPKPFKADLLRELLNRHAGDEVAFPRSALGIADEKISADALAGAIRENQLVLHFQPKVDLPSRATVGFEALVRWNHPERGLIAPDKFIPLAEATGLIGELSEWTFDAGLSWLASLPRKDMTLALNLSPSVLRDLYLADRLSQRCRLLGVDPQRITLELTETNAMSDPGDALDIMTRLRIKGFKLSIDDFGTGYSSMVQLARLPFSELKIDKGFVVSMAESAESKKIVEATIRLGHSLGLTTVAEGVETQEVLMLLDKLGCDLAQGYFFSRPLPGDLAMDFIAR
jgi:EAL domain-containing protein (putative c-di-GMP-specific phosphodiesterase class I)/CheY-like chemotaxis protein